MQAHQRFGRQPVGVVGGETPSQTLAPGGKFGAARGVLICIVAAVFANFLLAPKLPDMVSEAKSYPPLLSAGDWLITLLPNDIEKQFTDFLQKKNQNPDVAPNDTTTPEQGTENGDSTQPPADTSSAPAAPAA